YSSNGGNGLLGMGFDISGLSSIHRCETSIVRDGYKDGVDYDDNDQFCLDGPRLVAVSGTYGADGTEYRTEFDSITKVVSYGSEGTLMQNGPNQMGNNARNPLWFKVWTADGRIHEYGNTPQARRSRSVTFTGCPPGYVYVSIWLADPVNSYLTYCLNETTNHTIWEIQTQTETRTHEWAVNQTADRFNNRLVYSYYDDDANGEHRIERIDHNDAGGTAKNSVRFTYEARPDVSSGYFAGAPLRQAQRLKTVAGYAGNTKLRELQLSYNV